MLELGANPGNIAVVRSELNEWRDRFRASTNEELAGFLAFQATGHNAGINHTIPAVAAGQAGFSPHNSYMSEACCIIEGI